MNPFLYVDLVKRVSEEIANLGGETLAVVPTSCTPKHAIGYAAWLRTHDRVLVTHHFIAPHDSHAALLMWGYYSNPDQDETQPAILQACSRASKTLEAGLTTPEELTEQELSNQWECIVDHWCFAGGALFKDQDLIANGITPSDFDSDRFSDYLIERGNEYLSAH